MHVFLNILVAVLFIAGAVALLVCYDKIVNYLFGTVKRNPVEDLPIHNKRIANIVGSEYTAYILSIAVGAVLQFCKYIWGHYIMGFHGFWSSLCTLLPILVFMAFALHVYFVLQAENRIGRIIGRIAFLVGLCIYGFLAGAFAMALTLIILALIFVLWFTLTLIGGSGDKIIIKGIGLFGGDKVATRNWDGTYTDESGNRWRRNSDDTVSKI